MAVYLLSDLDLPIRHRMYREPAGPHAAVVRGGELRDALAHLHDRPDCRALAVLGVPPDDADLPEAPDLQPLAGRRLFVADPDGARMRSLAERGRAAGADVEWHRGVPPFDVLAAWLLPVAAVVLAAGGGTRMGANKMLLDLGQQPMVRHVVEAATEGGAHLVHVVYASEDVREVVGEGAVCVHNPDAESGQASSLAVGLRSLPEEAAGAVVLLGDQPLVGARTVRMVLRAWREEGATAAVAASFGEDGWRPPVVIDRSLWPDLLELTGDQGARLLFQRQPDLLSTVPAAGRPDDVDTPEDYARILHLFPRRAPG
jgi:molybdenum cofactor cytidylyltransferase